MNPMLPDDPNSKLNVCVQNVLNIWEEGKEQKLTQLLFCDLSTPKNDGNFNVYEDIRKKLIAAGVPENEIEFIHNADTEAKKAALFSYIILTIIFHHTGIRYSGKHRILYVLRE